MKAAAMEWDADFQKNYPDNIYSISVYNVFAFIRHLADKE